MVLVLFTRICRCVHSPGMHKLDSIWPYFIGKGWENRDLSPVLSVSIISMTIVIGLGSSKLTKTKGNAQTNKMRKRKIGHENHLSGRKIDHFFLFGSFWRRFTLWRGILGLLLICIIKKYHSRPSVCAVALSGQWKPLYSHKSPAAKSIRWNNLDRTWT